MDGESREADVRARLGDITGPEPGAAEKALIARLITSYLAKTPPGVDRLAELMDGGDPGDLRDHAHALKGSATNLGADSLAKVFAEVEHAARDGVELDARSTLDRVRSELTEVSAVMEKLAAEYA